MSRAESVSISTAIATADAAIEANMNAAALKQVLWLCQGALCTAQDDVQHLHDENAKLKATLRLRAPNDTSSKQLAWIKHPSLLEHAPLIVIITKKITFFEWAWIHKTPGGIGPCPIPDPNEAIASKYKDPAVLAKSIAYSLYTEFPVELHTALAEMPALRDAIVHQSTAGRTAMVKAVKDNVDIIFRCSYPGIDPRLSKESRPDNSPYRRLLLWDADLVDESMIASELFPPLIFTRLLQITEDMFCHEVLFRIARVLLFGNSSLKTGTISRSNGFTWGPQTDLFGLIAISVTLAVFIISGDKTFGSSSKTGQINYEADYMARKLFLEENAVDAPSQSCTLLEIWAREVYAGFPGLGSIAKGGRSAEGLGRDAAKRLFAGETISTPVTSGDDPVSLSMEPSPSVTVLTAPVSTHRLTPANAFTRNETPIHFSDSDSDLPGDGSISSKFSRARPNSSRALTSESTIMAFVPALTPLVQKDQTFLAPAPIISARSDLNPEATSDSPANHRHIAAGIESLTIDDHPNEASTSVTHGQRRTTGTRSLRKTPAPPKPTTRTTRARNSTTRS